MQQHELIGHGAEARLFRVDDRVIKVRPAKGYRLPEIDKKLRKQRTRREAKILESLEKHSIPAPKLLSVDDEEMKIEMSFIDGKKVKDVLTPEIAFKIGQIVGKLHAQDIVHSDLTTSNMIFTDKVYLIDFGLSFIDQHVEHKACDLHLLDRALESAHHDIYEECLEQVFKGYEEAYPDSKAVFERLEKVQKRGRHKRQ